MNCSERVGFQACFTDAAGVPVGVLGVHNFGKDINGDDIIGSTIYTDDAGVVIDTSAGTVTVGACPVSQPDVELLPLCEKLADGSTVKFVRRTITNFAPDGTATSVVEDFEEDLTTAYSVVDEASVGSCGCECPPMVAQGVLTSL